MTHRKVMLLLAACMLSACSTEPCAEPGEFGLIVELRDETGAPAAEGATVIARQGAFTESLGQVDELAIAGLVDRSGRFEVTITRPGYRTVERSDIELPDACGADPVVIEIGLEPE